MSRGQSAIEFVVLCSFMFLFFTILFIYVQSTLVDYTRYTKQQGVEAMQNAIKKELNLADQMPAGYERVFVLPPSIEGIPYTITVQNETPPLKDAIIVQLQDNTTALLYVDQDVSGTLNTGTNKLRKTTSIILN